MRKEYFEIDKYVNFEDLSEEEARKRVDEAPNSCPITGLFKIESYYFDEGVVYGYSRPYDAYTLPSYDEENQEFNRVRIDMDNEFSRDYEFVCSLDDIKDREDFEEIKKFYGIGYVQNLIDEIVNKK